jgi:hypothetical protein
VIPWGDTMCGPILRVLRVTRPSADLRDCFPGRFRELECAYETAHSFGQAVALLREAPFDLVLSDLDLPDGKGSRLIPCLLGTEASLFFSVEVEDGCWWLPGVVRGESHWGAEALRRHEFLRLLDSILVESTPPVPPPPDSQERSRGDAATREGEGPAWLGEWSISQPSRQV